MKFFGTLLVVAVLSLSGCGNQGNPTTAATGSLGQSLPDYHTLVGPENKPKLQAALAKCNESSTQAEKFSNPWCGLAEKADRCDRFRSMGKGLPPIAEPNGACPAK